jgi:hypothetical protein
VRAFGTFKRVCVFCHTPHNAITDSSLINAPLWNHELSTYSSYTVKSPGIFNDPDFGHNIYLSAQPPNPPDGASKLCLSCHDGTVSVGAVRSIIGNITMDTSHACLDGQGRISNSVMACDGLYIRDLTKKHVVSVPMNTSMINNSSTWCTNGWATRKLAYPWNGATGLPATVLLRPTMESYDGSLGIAGDASGVPAKKYRAGYNYGVQCSTCHDPHYWVTGDTLTTAGQKFLVTDFNSLCSACHVDCT